jgi:hypothetical protein
MGDNKSPKRTRKKSEEDVRSPGQSHSTLQASLAEIKALVGRSGGSVHHARQHECESQVVESPAHSDSDASEQSWRCRIGSRGGIRATPLAHQARPLTESAWQEPDAETLAILQLYQEKVAHQVFPAFIPTPHPSPASNHRTPPHESRTYNHGTIPHRLLGRNGA